jgi:predicted dehydrogenase
MGISAAVGRDAAATFSFGLDAPSGDDRIAVHGTTGSLVLEGTMSQWWSDQPGRLGIRTSEGERSEYFDGVDNYALQLRAFERFARGSSADGFASVDDGLAAARFTEQAYASAVTITTRAGSERTEGEDSP